MKQVAKIVEMTLVLSLCLATTGVFATNKVIVDIIEEKKKVLDDDAEENDLAGMSEVDFIVESAEWLASISQEDFQAWVASIKETKPYRALSYLVPAVTLCFVLYYIWSAATGYCIPGTSVLDNSQVFCSTVNEIGSTSEWLVGVITSYLEPLWESAVSFIQKTSDYFRAEPDFVFYQNSSHCIVGDVTVHSHNSSGCILGDINVFGKEFLCPINFIHSGLAQTGKLILGQLSQRLASFKELWS